MFRNMEIFESLCFSTWRFKNLRGLNTKIFESLYFNTRRFKNLCVLKHGGFVRQNCSYFPISVFQYTEIQKYPCIGTRRFKNFSVLYKQTFFKRPITQWNCNRWWKYFRVWVRGLSTTNLWKNRVRKSHATVPLIRLS